jgi:hypothetical protein
MLGNNFFGTVIILKINSQKNIKSVTGADVYVSYLPVHDKIEKQTGKR